MIRFINMDFNGSQWWLEYEENGASFINYYNTEAEAYVFYHSIIMN